MIVTDFGVAIVNGDSHLSSWIVEQRKLDVDGSAYEVAKRFIKPGDVVVDGGACLGDHTVVYLDAVGPTGVVHAFEPNPVAFECLAYNCPRALIYREALGAEPGRGDISMGQGEDCPPHNNLGAACVVMVPGGVVRIVALDNFFFKSLAFLKLDIEGMEFEALRGAVETIRRCQPVIMVEMNSNRMRQNNVSAQDVFSFMDNLGYSNELRDTRYKIEDVEHADVLFIPNGSR